jgi:ribonuclease HI
MNTFPIVVFSDGASKGNPGPGGWGVVSVTPDGQVTELGGGEAHTTNNRMELTGAIEALAHLEHVSGPIAIYTDSTYVIKGIREWIWAWRRRGWKTAEGKDVLNRDLWEQLSSLVEARGKSAISWHYVRGHHGICGNERVDEIADGLARGLGIEFYRGPLSDYGRPILDIPDDTDVPARR